MSTDIVVGLLSLLGLAYLAWTQARQQRSESISHEAEAVQHLTTSLLQAIETLANRDRLISELREHILENQERIEALEAHDEIKSARITELAMKVTQLENERMLLIEERDALSARLKPASLSESIQE